mmetsp:Transcript_54648/g.132717  ORF Transcript_54648/g.132717 Transcript_54648/m.132717 type:complete len:382 (-) Transcript_54648:431-1576(-)|eukprot:CAMPEP_0113509278 /NCGR_PEP_ID=MMETSP0014_2-20120614/37480_1 /TAXON_ID=2857 /ORGANISM="Nitzschia sp." /LENGTH=381 /DNA_ID=CAMNT_0000405077 /DNA_START=279 /DNA_END=1424 /DNA_ORIENTATION=+ /assembly_acc=CAM_ASM_000159
MKGLVLLALLVVLQVGQYCRGNPTCGGNNLTEFDAPTPPQTATNLNLQFTCIYNDFNPDPTNYTIVPTPVIRIEPGDTVGFYSNPPQIYDWVDNDGTGTTLSLAHNPYTSTTPADGGESEGTETVDKTVEVELVITWPPSQLETLSVVPDLADGATVLIAEGFTALKSIEFTNNGVPAGLQAYLSTDGTVTVSLKGGMGLGVNVAAVGDTTELVLDVQTDEADLVFSSTTNNIVGKVHAANVATRTGKVFVDGVGAGGIVSDGNGPGLLLADDCERVDGECRPFDEGTTLKSPETDCQVTDVCLTTVSTLSQPSRSCELVTGAPPECAVGPGPTDPPSSGAGCGMMNRVDTNCKLESFSPVMVFVVSSIVAMVSVTFLDMF